MTEETEKLHPLAHRWALWFLKGDRNKNWEDCLKQVAVFDTVESFWATVTHIQPASQLSFYSDYYVFKEGIKPMWEDVGNVRGGRWFVTIDKHSRADKLDSYWIELIMAMVGEQFESHGDNICGAVVNVRQKGDKVALWTRDASLDAANFRIGQIIKDKLQLSDKEPLKYEVHKDSCSRTGSVVKPKMVIPSKESSAPRHVPQ